MKKNLVIVGFGGMGGWHGNYARTSDVVNLAGIYDIKPERCEYARTLGINTYSSLDEVLADKSVDIITIATPNHFHHDIAIAAMDAGKNVISEKPVTMSCESLAEMIAAAERNNVKFTVHQNRRWDVDFLATKSLYESGDLGQILNIESRIHGSRGIPGDWRGVKEYGGGMILDWGVHLIDQALQIIKSDIDSVYCTVDNITNAEVDDGFKLTIYFTNGQKYFIEVETNNFINMPRFYMRGWDGTAIIQEWTQKCKVVKCTTRAQQDVKPVKTAAGLTKTMAPRDNTTTETYEIDIPKSDVHDFYRNFCAAIDGTQSQLITHKEMMRVVKVMEAAFASAESGQRVKFCE